MIYIFDGMNNYLKDTLIQLLRTYLTPQTQMLLKKVKSLVKGYLIFLIIL